MDNNKKLVTATDAAVDDGKGKQAAPVDKPTNKRDHDAMSASSSAVVAASVPVSAAPAAPAPTPAPAPAPAPAVAEVAANERPSLPTFPCRMQCPHVFHSEKALCGHMRKHPGRDWKGTNPPPEASTSAQGGGNGDNEAGGAGTTKKKMKKGLPFDLNELPPPEEDDDAEKN